MTNANLTDDITEDPRLSLTRAPTAQARHLPPDYYTSAEILKLEKERIFFKDWLVVGREDEWPNPGDYRAMELLDEPIIICRNNAGELKAFSNVCRHRGVAVAEGMGNAKAFRCPYHAWTYSLDGKLLGTDRDVSALLDGLSDEAASREAEFITVFYGEDVNEEDARKACDAFTRKCPDAEVNLICGGQPVYYYIISIE